MYNLQPSPRFSTESFKTDFEKEFATATHQKDEWHKNDALMKLFKKCVAGFLPDIFPQLPSAFKCALEMSDDKKKSAALVDLCARVRLFEKTKENRDLDVSVSKAIPDLGIRSGELYRCSSRYEFSADEFYDLQKALISCDPHSKSEYLLPVVERYILEKNLDRAAEVAQESFMFWGSAYTLLAFKLTISALVMNNEIDKALALAKESAKEDRDSSFRLRAFHYIALAYAQKQEFEPALSLIEDEIDPVSQFKSYFSVLEKLIEVGKLNEFPTILDQMDKLSKDGYFEGVDFPTVIDALSKYIELPILKDKIEQLQEIKAWVEKAAKRLEEHQINAEEECDSDFEIEEDRILVEAFAFDIAELIALQPHIVN